MDSSNGYRSSHQNNGCECKDCESCSDDSDRICVSVNPKRFNLPPPKGKKARMEIKNKNPFPIYFKADTSNSDVFRAKPNSGRIPPKSQVSVIVQFFDSARPVRRHEEVLVITSVRPFDPFALYEENICPFCFDQLGSATHYHPSSNNESGQHEVSEEFRFYCESGGHATEKDFHSKNNKISDETIETKHFVPRNLNGNSLLTSSEETVSSKRVVPNVEKHSKESASEANADKGLREENIGSKHAVCNEFRKPEYAKNYFQVPSMYPSVWPDTKDRNTTNGTQELQDAKERNLTNGTQELQEICLHAFVHHPVGASCQCDNCFVLGTSAGRSLEFQKVAKELSKEQWKDLTKQSSTELKGQQRSVELKELLHRLQLKEESSKDLKEKLSKELEEQHSKKLEGQMSKEPKELKGPMSKEPKELKGQRSKELIEQRAKELKDQRSQELTDQRLQEIKQLRKELLKEYSSIKLRKSKSEEDSVSGRKEIKAEDDTDDSDEDKAANEKKSEAHIRARVVDSGDSKDTSSDTEISLISSKDVRLPKKRTKIISEEDFRRKVEKARVKKIQKKMEEDTSTTSTTETSTTKSSSDESTIAEEQKITLKAVDEKCVTLLHVTWLTLLLMLSFFVILFSTMLFAVFFSPSPISSVEFYHMPCFYDFFG